MKQPPPTVKIGLSKYRLALTDLRETTSAWGLCDSAEKAIRLEVKQQPHQMLHTFFHELLHAIDSEYSVEVGENESEERIVDLQGHGLTQVLVDNPDLLGWVNHLARSK